MPILRNRRKERFRSVGFLAVLFLFLLASAPKLRAANSESRPLPDAAELLRSVQTNQKNIDALVKNYTFTKFQTLQELDKNGAVKKETTEEYEVFFHNRHQIERLVKRNGAALTDSDRKKQQEKIDKQIADIDKQDVSPQKDKSKFELTIDSFLRCSQFLNGRRALFRGKETAVYDFQPAPRCEAENRGEKILGKVDGVIWIDEADKEVVRMEIRLIDGVGVGGFLASIKKGSQLVFEQQKVNNEIWLPSSGELHFAARVLFKGMQGNVLFRYTDYKKFRVDTTMKVVEEAATPTPQ